jgi:molecular chaperone DnaK
MVYTCEKTLADLGDKLSKEHTEKLEEAIKKAKDALKNGDIDKIKSETEILQKVIQEAGASIYAEAAKKQQASDQAGSQVEENNDSKDPNQKSNQGKDEAVDAEYEVKE